jgi:hypothetical protein
LSPGRALPPVPLLFDRQLGKLRERQERVLGEIEEFVRSIA